MCNYTGAKAGRQFLTWFRGERMRFLLPSSRKLTQYSRLQRVHKLNWKSRSICTRKACVPTGDPDRKYCVFLDVDKYIDTNRANDRPYFVPCYGCYGEFAFVFSCACCGFSSNYLCGTCVNDKAVMNNWRKHFPQCRGCTSVHIGPCILVPYVIIADSRRPLKPWARVPAKLESITSVELFDLPFGYSPPIETDYVEVEDLLPEYLPKDIKHLIWLFKNDMERLLITRWGLNNFMLTSADDKLAHRAELENQIGKAISDECYVGLLTSRRNEWHLTLAQQLMVGNRSAAYTKVYFDARFITVKSFQVIKANPITPFEQEEVIGSFCVKINWHWWIQRYLMVDYLNFENERGN